MKRKKKINIVNRVKEKDKMNKYLRKSMITGKLIIESERKICHTQTVMVKFNKNQNYSS